MLGEWKLSNLYARFIIPLLAFAAIGVILYGLNRIAVSPSSGSAYAEPAETNPVGSPNDRAGQEKPLGLRYDLKQVLNERAELEASLRALPAQSRAATRRKIAETFLAECDLLRFYYETGRPDAGPVKSLPGKIRSRARKGRKFMEPVLGGPRAIAVGALLDLYTLTHVGEYRERAPAIQDALLLALKESAESRPVRIALGRFFFAAPTLAGGDLDRAVEYLKEVRKTEAGALWLGRTYMAMGRPDEALIHLRAAEKANRDNPEVAAWIKIAKAEAARNPLDQMRDLLRVGREQYDPAPVRRARDTFELLLAQAAKTSGGEAGDENRKADTARLARLHYLIALSNLAECDILKLQRKQLDWASEDEKDGMLERTDLLVKEGREHCDKALALDAGLADAHRVKGVLISHLIRGMISGISQGPKAKDQILKGLELDGASPEGHEAMALMYYSNPRAFGGDVNKAILELRTALKVRTNSLVYSFLGKCYLKKERYERAVLYFKKALSIDPRNLEAEIFLARAVAAKKKEEEEQSK